MIKVNLICIDKKCCRGCREIKEKAFFSKNKTIRDGFEPYCKSCCKKRNKDYSKLNKLKNISYNELKIFSKKCSVCDKNKEMLNFNRSRVRPDGYCSVCRNCVNEKVKNDRINNNVKNFNKNFDYLLKKFCYNCKETFLLKDFFHDFGKDDGFETLCKECSKQKTKKYRKGPVGRQTVRNFFSRKRKKDPCYKVHSNFSRRIRKYFKKQKLSKNGIILFYKLPYTIIELKKHIEKFWEPWMNWENYGRADDKNKSWHIDHIYPHSLLPYDSFEHPNFLKCWSLNNLRPLEAKENLKKGNKIK